MQREKIKGRIFYKKPPGIYFSFTYKYVYCSFFKFHLHIRYIYFVNSIENVSFQIKVDFNNFQTVFCFFNFFISSNWLGRPSHCPSWLDFRVYQISRFQLIFSKSYSVLSTFLRFCPTVRRETENQFNNEEDSLFSKLLLLDRHDRTLSTHFHFGCNSSWRCCSAFLIRLSPSGSQEK